MYHEASLKADAEAAFQAALAAAEPGRRVTEWLKTHAGAVRPEGRLAVIAIGKAACAMISGALAVRDTDPGEVLVVTKDGHGDECPADVRVVASGHPRPDSRSLDAGEEVLRRVHGLGADDELLLLVSGGASALAEALPSDIPPEDWFAANEALVGGGLTIHAVNAVRKHCSRLKGGRLAEAAAPARVTALLLSDVVGDDPAVIGSGPAAADPSTFGDALEVLAGLPRFPNSLRAFLERGDAGKVAETPKPGNLAGVRNAVVGNNRLALDAAGEELASRGYQPMPMTSRLQGEAKEVARVLAAVGLDSRKGSRPVAPPAAFLWGGEATVTLGPSPGEGGRNQEMALAMAGDLAGAGGIGALCAGTDGTDGPTDAAGGWVDGTTCQRLAESGSSLKRVLARHDSGTALASLDDRLITGPTDTNVMDLTFLLVARQG
ncbi:glycerate kinase type-2 family protein [Thiohalorhabdus sp.]|uniref:glycerate kinase type-2 family protein n=1 Tax=Thiohalorhabdus sp. TaxID=3094134 RepID=UPI002FC2C910